MKPLLLFFLLFPIISFAQQDSTANVAEMPTPIYYEDSECYPGPNDNRGQRPEKSTIIIDGVTYDDGKTIYLSEKNAYRKINRKIRRKQKKDSEN